MSKCEHGLTTAGCCVCSSPKYGEKKMTTLKTLEMALEALKTFQEISDFTPASAVHAITALRQQIALEKMVEDERQLGIQMQPAKWVSLTEDEVWDIYKRLDRLYLRSMQYMAFSRDIEQRLKEKNGSNT